MDLTHQISDWCGDSLLESLKKKNDTPPNSIFEIGAGTGVFTQKLYSYMESGLFEIQDHSFVDLFKNQNSLKADNPSIKTLFEESDFEIKTWPNCAQLVVGNLPFSKSNKIEGCILKNVKNHQGDGLYAFSFISKVDFNQICIYKYQIPVQEMNDIAYSVSLVETNKSFKTTKHSETTHFFDSLELNLETFEKSSDEGHDLLIHCSALLIQT
jgi:phospholipid N-methyltransferase